MGGCCAKQNAVEPDRSRYVGIGDATEEFTAAEAIQGPEDSITAYHCKSAVKVAVVVRPLLPAERQQPGNAAECIEVLGKDTVRAPPQAHSGANEAEKLSFAFDRAYRGAGVHRQLYFELVVPLLQQYLAGFNATVFAYGQTGAGKTFTMGTALSAAQMLRPGEESLIPAALRLLFESLAGIQQDYSTSLKLTYVQIHEDTIKDLLQEAGGPQALGVTLREHPTRGVFVENAKEVVVTSLADVAKALEDGNSRRAVAAHNLNEFSSRSHAVLQLVLEQSRRPSARPEPGKHQFLSSKLNLVDLAGSERAKETGTAGQHFQEGVQINKGLLALGNVISALSEGTSRRHVPYRDSKLTRLLQDSLGGSSETLMVACVSPAPSCLDQSVSTLRYASRARRIQNRLLLNSKYSPEEEVTFLRAALAEREADLARLQQENAALRATATAAKPGPQKAAASGGAGKASTPK